MRGGSYGPTKMSRVSSEEGGGSARFLVPWDATMGVALSLALHRPRISKSVRGGVLTPAISCGEVLFDGVDGDGECAED
mgnify:CR=1 FL=1